MSLHQFERIATYKRIVNTKIYQSWNLHLKHSSAFMALHFWILTVFVQIGSHLDSHCHPVMLGVIEGHRAVDPASMQKAMR
jgi:hypothetical protein